MESPRLYYSILLFTTSNSKYKCDICKTVTEHVTTAYAKYLEQYDIATIISSCLSPYKTSNYWKYSIPRRFLPSVVYPSYPALTSDLPNKVHLYEELVYLFILDLDDVRNIISYLNISTVPRLYVDAVLQ